MLRVFNEVRFLKSYILSFDSVSQELLGRRSTEQRLLVPLHTHTHTHTHTAKILNKKHITEISAYLPSVPY